MRDYETDVKEFELDLNCPRCGHLVRAIPQTQAVYHISESSDTAAYLVVRCPRHLCDLAFVIYDRLNKCVDRVFPYPDCQASDFHESIPDLKILEKILLKPVNVGLQIQTKVSLSYVEGLCN